MEIEKIIRSKRKSFCIEINDEGKIILRVPDRAKDGEIKNFVNKHKDWIEKKLKVIENRKIKYKPKKFIQGEEFLFLGKFYKLNIVENKSSKFYFNNGFYLSKDYLDRAYELFKNFYKERAKKIISKRVEFYGTKYGFKYSKIKITSSKKRWGSCTGKGNLNFTYRLSMAPIKVIDYVVAHELIHLIDKTHKKNFYEKVKEILPDYKERKDWLDKNGYLLKL